MYGYVVSSVQVSRRVYIYSHIGVTCAHVRRQEVESRIRQQADCATNVCRVTRAYYSCQMNNKVTTKMICNLKCQDKLTSQIRTDISNSETSKVTSM